MKRLFFRCFFLFPLFFSSQAHADENITICFNYGCLTQAEVVYSEEQLARLQETFSLAENAEAERVILSQAMGPLLGWAGEQTAIFADRGGNLADAGVYGKMDCIDHSTTTTRLLKMLEKRGFLAHHRVLEPVKRTRFLVFDHFSAQIEELPAQNSEAMLAVILPEPLPESLPKKPLRFAVDTWFYDNGAPATIIPLDRWFAGESPNDFE